MTRIVLDDKLRTTFLEFNRPLELCDTSGRVLGKFIPAVDYAAVERARPPLSDEDLDRRNQSASFSTAEVLARLEQLEQP
ncbi:MAG: hypothetical protein B7Z73_04885 [Planctomycetia bacterium 21-64-5]|nr:MAG: hypothetical protein B7Z73_04885 [Planctomycetia bacterium 21-64-5]HQU41524.1 hypothetical protein [Pirellulales bacterium]